MIIYDSVVKTSTKMEQYNHGEGKKRLLEMLLSKVGNITVRRKRGIYASKREHVSCLTTSLLVILLINVAPINQSNGC